MGEWFLYVFFAAVIAFSCASIWAWEMRDHLDRWSRSRRRRKLTRTIRSLRRQLNEYGMDDCSIDMHPDMAVVCQVKHGPAKPDCSMYIN